MPEYRLPTPADKDILHHCEILEKMELGAEDQHLVSLIKNQLLNDWRKPLLKELARLLGKYN